MASHDIPAVLAGDLAAAESVLAAIPARLAPSIAGTPSLPGVVVLTSERLAFIPGAETPARLPPPDTLSRAVHELWALVRPVLLESFPVASLFAARATPAPLAGRGRPGIEVPLQELRRSFVAGGAPGFVGIEIALPPPDPRPPFALYLEVGGRARELADDIDRRRASAPPRPELERPYGLYYLFRPLPEVHVRTDGRSGLLGLGLDGPTFGRGRQKETFVPYESIGAVELAEETSWRRGEVRFVLDDKSLVVRASRAALPRLFDLGRLVGELAGVPVRTVTGRVSGGRIVWRASWLSAAGVAAYEIARLLLGG